MKTIKSISKAIILGVLLPAYIGCSSSLLNLADSKKMIKKYYETGEYNAELNKIVLNAIVDFKNVEVQKNSVVIFDVDDTAISNYEFMKSMDFGNVSSAWDKYMVDSNAPVIPEIKMLYDFLISRRIKIIFLSGRNYKNYEGTYKNLKNAGYNDFDTLIVRSEGQLNSPASDYKSIERLVIANLGYNIIGCVGDQQSDLEGGNAGIKIKLPNYLYFVE
ncbi:MAG: hypothetical protein NTX22_11575 [Ignavibacteriales bacterium]|nr:hypothetical protein [Ignavibacteriales bacterium]